MSDIRYDSYFVQLQDGSFDIKFEKEPLELDYKFNIVDIVNCQLFSNKRIDNQNVPLFARGGSVCDIIYNTTGERHGSLIWHYAIANMPISEKISTITAEIKSCIQLLKSNDLINNFSVEYVGSNNSNSYLIFNLIIDNRKYDFFVKYDN